MTGQSGEIGRKEPTDYLCMAESPDSFICNEQPGHGGDHIAWAGFGDERHSVQKWPQRRQSGRTQDLTQNHDSAKVQS